MTQYRCKYFKIKELVAPDMLKVSEDILWLLFDDRILRIADQIREEYGACTVNANGLENCGLRSMSAGGAAFSQHKFGRALDLHIVAIELDAGKIKDSAKRKEYKIMRYNEVRQELAKKFPELNMENNISWLHIDVGNRVNQLFNP